jgi:8-oxo-dGTP diphosphatase
MKELELYQVSLKVLLFNDKDEVLLLKGQPGSFTGLFDLPGGRIDADEHDQDFAQILDRELKEEAGDIEYVLDDSPQALGHARNPKNGKSVLYVVFEARHVSGNIVISDEHTDYRWMKLENLDPDQMFAGGLNKAIKNYLD